MDHELKSFELKPRWSYSAAGLYFLNIFAYHFEKIQRTAQHGSVSCIAVYIIGPFFKRLSK